MMPARSLLLSGAGTCQGTRTTWQTLQSLHSCLRTSCKQNCERSMAKRKCSFLQVPSWPHRLSPHPTVQARNLKRAATELCLPNFSGLSQQKPSPPKQVPNIPRGLCGCHARPGRAPSLQGRTRRGVSEAQKLDSNNYTSLLLFLYCIVMVH